MSSFKLAPDIAVSKESIKPCSISHSNKDDDWVLGGAEGDRTPDLVIANDALSQLSYCPNEPAKEVPHQHENVKQSEDWKGQANRPALLPAQGANRVGFSDATITAAL